MASASRKAVISKERRENTTIIVEVCIILLGSVTIIAGVFVDTLQHMDVVPYLTEERLRIVITVSAFFTTLAAIGLLYKAISLSRQLKHARRNVSDLRNLADVRETFIGMAEHRLRTPLSGIRWGIGSIQESENLTEDEREMLDKTKEKVMKANDLVERLLKIQHFELNDFQLSDKEDSCDLGEMIKKILEDLSHVADENNVEVKFDSAMKVTIPCDEYLLRSALTNVLDNSIRYSPDGKVQISIHPADEGVKLVVADNGIGMSPIELQHVFDRFYRGESAQKLAPHETGLGMYLTKQVVGLHGGTINVESQKGEGTQVTVTLPQE